MSKYLANCICLINIHFFSTCCVQVSLNQIFSLPIDNLLLKNKVCFPLKMYQTAYRQRKLLGMEIFYILVWIMFVSCSFVSDSLRPCGLYWSGLPFPSPWDLPNPGIEPAFPTIGIFFSI